MATMSRYVLVNRENMELDHEYESYDEAVATAQELKYAVIERTYEYADSELVWTPDGSDRWPPKPRRLTRTKAR